MEKINLKSLFKSKLFVGSAVFVLLITTTTFYVLKEKEKALRVYTQKQLTKTVEEKKVVEGELAETIRTKEIMQKELAAQKEKSFALEKEMEEKKQQIQITLDKLEKEIATRQQTEAQLLTAVKEKKLLEAKLKELTKAPKIVELEKIIIKPTSRITGKILAVNKEYAFVMIDLGKANKLNLADVLSVYRDNKFIGRVQIEDIEEDICAAAILPEWLDREFKEDDEARVL